MMILEPEPFYDSDSMNAKGKLGKTVSFSRFAVHWECVPAFTAVGRGY